MSTPEKPEGTGSPAVNERGTQDWRIALFTGNYNHTPDGVSLTLNRLVRHLEKEEGASVEVFGPTVEDPPMDHWGSFTSVPSWPAPGRPDYRISLGLPRAARERLESFQPTLFHIATPDILGFRALRLARRWDLPAVASYHTHFSSYLKYYGFEPLEGFLWRYLRWFYDQCQQIYVPSLSMAHVLRAHGIDRGLRIWERGVETDRFNPDYRSIRWRRERGIADDEVVVSFVSRLVWEKGLGTFAEIVRELERREIPHRSMVVGEGPAKEKLERQLPNTLFTGHLDGDALSHAYASSDVFLFPSDTETFGNVTLEAMASGVPTVCADATGSDVLVQDGETGFLADPDDIDRFVDRVRTLIEEPGLRYQMGQAARERACTYDWHSVLTRISDYYREILAPEEILQSSPSPATSTADLAPASAS